MLNILLNGWIAGFVCMVC